MDVRLALHAVAAEHRLDRQATQQLFDLAALHRQPARLDYWLPRGLAALGAALAGTGVIFWIAANWDQLGRAGHFALLQGLFVAACAGAWWRRGARVALGLVALLTIGALFAYFGQTYQTGADAWQLFALWAALALPLCLAARSDIVWTPWSVVAMTAIVLWQHAHSHHHEWSFQAQLSIDLGAWCVALLLTALLSPLGRAYTGAGPWSLRTSLSLAIGLIGVAALSVLFEHESKPEYWIGLLTLLALTAIFSGSARYYDIYCLSALSLAVMTLIVGAMGEVLFRGSRHDGSGRFLLLAIVTASLLALAVPLILRRERAHQLAAEAA